MSGSSVSIVAHEDDDLLFQNPDIADWIATGLPHCTVYVTAGEFNGQPAGGDRGLYASSRQAGLRAAYAQMAGVANQWTQSTQPVSGRQVEVDTLLSTPTVSLVFLSLPDGGDSQYPGAVPNLLSGSYDSVPTIVVAGSPVTDSVNYTAADLVATLRALLDMFRATVVRAEDPCPNPHYSGDHGDHIAVAKFVDESVAGYHGPDGNGNFTLINYRCYNIRDSQSNLTASEAAAKLTTFNIYQAHDPLSADLGWTSSQYYRWSPGTAWVGRDADGRLEAFAVQDGAVQNWYQPTPGATTWLGPVAMVTGPVTSHLAVGSRADGCLEVFALRKDTHEIIHANQTLPSHVFSGWSSLGNPDGALGPYVSPPTVVPNSDGRLQVFVRNSNGGLSSIWQTPQGGWSSWLDLGGGPDLDDDAIAGVTTADGRIEIFASTHDGVEHWYQGSANGTFAYDPDFPLASVPTAGPPAAARRSDGLLEVLYRNPVDGCVHVLTQALVNGTWQSAPQNLGGPGGLGEPLIVTGADGVSVIACRAEHADLSAALRGGSWTNLGGRMLGYPGAALGPDDTITIVVIDTDGALCVNTRSPAGSWSGWTKTSR